jgi:hypothetical protein
LEDAVWEGPGGGLAELRAREDRRGDIVQFQAAVRDGEAENCFKWMQSLFSALAKMAEVCASVGKGAVVR